MSREKSLTLRIWPWRQGLATAGQQSSIGEDSLWQAKNMLAGLDGLLAKRPGLNKWGQTLKEPTSSAAVSWFEPFLDSAIPNWVQNDASSGKITASASQGVLQMNAVSGSSNETFTLSRGSAASAVDDASFRFTGQVINVQAYTASDTNADTFHFRIADSSTTGKEFAVWSGGLYYKKASDNTYELVANTEDFGAGSWATVDIQVDESGNTLVYINEVLADTIASSAIASATLTRANSTAEIVCEVDPSAQYSVKLTGCMWADTVTEPFVATTIEDIADFRAFVGAGSRQRMLVVAAGDYIWHDASLLGVWRPILAKTYPNVSFATYRQQIVWVETDGIQQSKLWSWTGEGSAEPEEQDQAPNAKFAVEHQQRLWVAGDRSNPLRVYYSADRQPNVWFAPGQNNISDQFDTQLDAGYLEVPPADGDEITAVYGDYYGQLLVFTRQGVYRVEGSGINSYKITNVSKAVGCENERAVAQVGNDVWFISSEGVHTISATDKFGDLTKGFMSVPIQDLWGGDASAVSPINKTYIGSSRLAYNPELNLVYVAVPQTTDTTAQRVFVFNTINEQWYGPWDIDSRAMDSVELAYPVTDVIMHGGAAGEVLYTNPLYKSDNGTTYESVIETAILNGRSLDPSLVGVAKTWKRIRVYFLPRGDWTIKAFTKVDSGFYPDENSLDPNQNFNQNVFEAYSLTEDFRLGKDPDGRLQSREAMGYVEIRPELRGYGLALKLVQSGGGEDMVIQGIEVDFIPHSHERE